jgi:hypothetical protein
LVDVILIATWTAPSTTLKHAESRLRTINLFSIKELLGANSEGFMTAQFPAAIAAIKGHKVVT